MSNFFKENFIKLNSRLKNKNTGEVRAYPFFLNVNYLINFGEAKEGADHKSLIFVRDCGADALCVLESVEEIEKKLRKVKGEKK